MSSSAGSNNVPLGIRLATAVGLRCDSRAFAALFLHEERQPQNLEAVLEEELRRSSTELTIIFLFQFLTQRIVIVDTPVVLFRTNKNHTLT